MKENTNNELEHLTGFIYNNNRGGEHIKSRVITNKRNVNIVQCTTLNNFYLHRLAPHTHTHTQRNGGRGLYLHLPASCGLLELVRWRDSNPPPTTQHQAPGTKNGATDASQHGHGPDENASRQDKASSLFLLYDGANLPAFDEANLLALDEANLACF